MKRDFRTDSSIRDELAHHGALIILNYRVAVRRLVQEYLAKMLRQNQTNIEKREMNEMHLRAERDSVGDLEGRRSEGTELHSLA